MSTASLTPGSSPPARARRSMTRRQRRLILILTAGIVIAAAGGLVLFALTDKIVFFNSPSEIATKHPLPGTRIRLGGLVTTGSVVRDKDARVSFSVTDNVASVPVTFVGILPDLFREGQGVVAEGTFGTDGVFVADTVLAKHDERYMPKEVADALKKSGQWKGEGTMAK
jgi:cytochrome c-type biogenesis protein CcmE